VSSKCSFFLQEAHKDMSKKTQGIEDESKKATINIKELADALEHYKANYLI
jgi:hypothetical protein